MPAEPVAAARSSAHTRTMGVLFNRGFLLAAICGLSLAAIPGSADEIRLKDGKKLYGVIVAYDDNMFKVKTDFGYVLVEKDKIASIIPVSPAPGSGNEAKPGAKNAPDSTKSNDGKQPGSEPTAPGSDGSAVASNVSAKT